MEQEGQDRRVKACASNRGCSLMLWAMNKGRPFEPWRGSCRRHCVGESKDGAEAKRWAGSAPPLPNEAPR